MQRLPCFFACLLFLLSCAPACERRDASDDVGGSCGDSNGVVHGAAPPVVVKLRQRIGYQDAAERCLSGEARARWVDLRRRFPGITMNRAFDARSPSELEALRPDLVLWFHVERPAGVDAKALADALKEESFVETAYVAQPTAARRVL